MMRSENITFGFTENISKIMIFGRDHRKIRNKLLNSIKCIELAYTFAIGLFCILIVNNVSLFVL